MRYLGAILAALLLFTACKDDPVSNQFEQQQIGSWLVVSPDSAKWIGSKSKADSVTLTSPGQQQLTVWRDTVTSSDFRLQFVDSTITRGVGVEEWFDERRVSTNGYELTGDSEAITITFRMNWIKDSNGPVGSMYINLTDADTLVKHYKIRVSGFASTISYILRP